LRTRNIILLVIILALLGFSLWAVIPLDSERLGREGLSLGLDLKGGSHLVYKADLSKKDPEQTDEDAMRGVIDKIERRVNSYGVTDPVIQKLGTDQVLVQLPGITDVEEALELIGKTAELDFRELPPEEQAEQPAEGEAGQEDIQWVKATATGSDGNEKVLTGAYLEDAQVVLDPQTNEPQVRIEWNEVGALLFGQITERNLQKPLAIFLDDELISAPTVQAVIEDVGVITGLTLEEARLLAIQLTSGALDVPLDIIQEKDVDATLGADSIRKSLIAGAIGLALVVLFMILYYRIYGFIAVIALLIYGAILLAIFKLVPITLTLPGVAALILSIGMAVDANVLIFERMKEELRAGRTIGAAVENGFNRAWPAIRDSNITTFIACIVLWWFGGTLGAFMVRFFAITLFIGVALSMFSAIVVTRTFLRFVVRAIARPAIYGVNK
jgi:preprotein translocase subunit SecD